MIVLCILFLLYDIYGQVDGECVWSHVMDSEASEQECLCDTEKETLSAETEDESGQEEEQHRMCGKTVHVRRGKRTAEIPLEAFTAVGESMARNISSTTCSQVFANVPFCLSFFESI